MITDVMKEVALQVGITTFITNSDERIESQLNRLTKLGDSAIMLVNYGLTATTEFDDDGILRNPKYSVTLLLMDKPEDLTKEVAEEKSEEMSIVCTNFLQVLNTTQRPKLRTNANAVTSIKVTLVPSHGAGKHAGVLCSFDVLDEVNLVC